MKQSQPNFVQINKLLDKNVQFQDIPTVCQMKNHHTKITQYCEAFNDPKWQKKFYVFLEHFKLGKQRKPNDRRNSLMDDELMGEEDFNSSLGQIVDAFNKQQLKPNFYLDEHIQAQLRNAEQAAHDAKNSKASIILNMVAKTKVDKPENPKSHWRHAQPPADRINSDAQNKKVSNKYMNYCSLEQIDQWQRQMDGLVEQFCKAPGGNSGKFDRRLEGFWELGESAPAEEKEAQLQALEKEEAEHTLSANPFEPIPNTTAFFNYEFDDLKDLITQVQNKLTEQNNSRNTVKEPVVIKPIENKEVKFKDHINNINQLKQLEENKENKERLRRQSERKTTDIREFNTKRKRENFDDKDRDKNYTFNRDRESRDRDRDSRDREPKEGGRYRDRDKNNFRYKKDNYHYSNNSQGGSGGKKFHGKKRYD